MSGMVVVPKSVDKVRICVDLTQLNKHVIQAGGIHADPGKVHTIKEISAATRVSGSYRFLGMSNQLRKF